MKSLSLVQEIRHIETIFVEFVTNMVPIFECLAISMPVYYAAAQQEYHHAPQRGRGRGRGEKGGNRAGGKGVCMRKRKGGSPLTNARQGLPRVDLCDSSLPPQPLSGNQISMGNDIF